VDTWDDFADASLDASLFAELCDILAALADDDASIFCTDKSTQSERVLS